MNSFQRVMNTLQGKPVDRVPVLAVLGAYGGKLTKTDLRTIYSDAAAWVAGQRAVQEAFGFDMILGTFDFPAIAEAFGGTVAWFDHQTPNLRRPCTTDVVTALAATLPDPARDGRLPVILSGIRQLAEFYHGRVPVFAAIPGPASFPALIVGLESWMEVLLFNEPLAAKLLDHSGRFLVNWGNALLEAGAAGLVVAEAFANSDMTTRSLFAERLLPHVRTVFGQLRGPLIFHHGGGNIHKFLDLVPGLPGVIGVGISPKESLAEARRLIGPDLALLGNLNNLDFPRLSADEMKEKCLACLREAAPGGKYLLCNSGADIPLMTSPEALRAMVSASEAYAAGGDVLQ